MAYYGQVFEDALSAREKCLIKLFAVAHAVQCPYCIDSYTNHAYNKDSQEQMIELSMAAVTVWRYIGPWLQAKNVLKNHTLR